MILFSLLNCLVCNIEVSEHFTHQKHYTTLLKLRLLFFIGKVLNGMRELRVKNYSRKKNLFNLDESA